MAEFMHVYGALMTEAGHITEPQLASLARKNVRRTAIQTATAFTRKDVANPYVCKGGKVEKGASVMGAVAKKPPARCAVAVCPLLDCQTLVLAHFCRLLSMA